MVKGIERYRDGGVLETMVMIFHGMSQDFKKEECADYLQLRGDYFKEVKRLINELHLWKLSSQPCANGSDD